ncbi:hypothetical protein BHE74_00043897, partial [Ensete ventricosum]
ESAFGQRQRYCGNPRLITETDGRDLIWSGVRFESQCNKKRTLLLRVRRVYRSLRGQRDTKGNKTKRTVDFGV